MDMIKERQQYDFYHLIIICRYNSGALAIKKNPLIAERDFASWL
jgi:hypothetical protein